MVRWGTGGPGWLDVQELKGWEVLSNRRNGVKADRMRRAEVAVLARGGSRGAPVVVGLEGAAQKRTEALHR